MVKCLVKILEPAQDGYRSFLRLDLESLPEIGTLIEDMVQSVPSLLKVNAVAIEHQVDVDYVIFCDMQMDCCGKAAVYMLGGINRLVPPEDLTSKTGEIDFIVAMRQLLDLTDIFVASPNGLTIGDIGHKLNALDGYKAMFTAAKIASACNGNGARTEIDRGFDGIGGWLR